MSAGDVYLVASAVCLLVAGVLAAFTLAVGGMRRWASRPRKTKWHDCRRQDNGD